MASRIDLPTPPASSATPSQHASPLPQPRRAPLKPGGPKESALIRYLDHGVNSIQKRVDNRLTNRRVKPAPGVEEGYAAFWQVVRDLDGLVDVVWVSASPNLQVPYLLNLAVLTAEFMSLFAFSLRSARSTFRLLSKLDYAFSSLLVGTDNATGEVLPGYENGRQVSTTDKVRLKGIVDRTRLNVVRVMSEESVVSDDGDADEPMDTDTEGAEQDNGHHETVSFEGFEEIEEDEDWEEQNAGSVYEKTIGELGDVLGGPPIGIITDDFPINETEQSSHASGFIESEDEMEL